MGYHAAPTLIRYAGDDQPPRNRTRLSAASMFIMGYDTLQIAEHLQITEAQALKRISLERSKRLRLNRPYEPRVSVSQASRATAGEVESTSVSLAGLSMQVRP